MGVYDKPKTFKPGWAWVYLHRGLGNGLGGCLPVPDIQWLTKEELNRLHYLWMSQKLTPKS